MAKAAKKTGDVEVILKTGLNRGNIKAVAGDPVTVGPGLAARLVSRDMATYKRDEDKRVAAKQKAAEREKAKVEAEAKAKADKEAAEKAKAEAEAKAQADKDAADKAKEEDKEGETPSSDPDASSTVPETKGDLTGDNEPKPAGSTGTESDPDSKKADQSENPAE